MLSAVDVTVCICSCVGFALNIAHLVRGGTLQTCLRSLGWLRQQLRRAERLPGGAPGESQSLEATIAQKVTERAMDRRVKQARGFAMPCTLWCFVISLEKVVTLLQGQPRSATAFGDVMFFAFYATMVLLVFWPSLIQPWSLNIWGSLIMFIAVLAASPMSTPTNRLLGVSITVGALRISIAMCISLPTFMLWNLAYWVSLSLHFYRTELSVKGECLAEGVGVQLVLGAEVTASMALVLITRAFHGVLEAEARQQVEAEASRSGLDASESLLGTICDAVLELDADLCLRRHSPSLATMLMHSPGNCLGSSKLDRFMHSEDDKLRFNASMQVPAHETGAIADAFHVKMRDSLGSKIDMEVFHVCFVNSLTGLPQHLVGLKEHSDVCAPPLGPEPDLPLMLDCEINDDLSEMSIVFDAVTFEIFSFSDAFTLRFGKCNAASLIDLLSPGDPQLEAFCEMVNDFANGSDPVAFFELRPLSLQLPGCALLSRGVSFTLTFGVSEGGRERVLGCMLLRASRRGSASESGSSGSAQSGSRRRSWSQRSAARRGTLADPGPRQRVGAPEEPRDLEPRQRVGAPEEPRDLEPRQWAVDLEVARDAEPQVQV